MNTIVRIEFTTGDRAGEVHYVDKLSTLYDYFTVSEIGAVLPSIYNLKIAEGKPAKTKRCIISKHKLLKPLKRKEEKGDEEE